MVSVSPEDCSSNDVPKSRGIRIIYDGECPVCSSYVTYMRLKQSVGTVELVNARGDPQLVSDLVKEGLEPDEGMIIELDGKRYHGADGIHVLALLSSQTDWFNRLNSLIFRNSKLCSLLYPAMRAGRNTLLRMLGRSKIANTTAHF